MNYAILNAPLQLYILQRLWQNWWEFPFEFIIAIAVCWIWAALLWRWWWSIVMFDLFLGLISPSALSNSSVWAWTEIQQNKNFHSWSIVIFVVDMFGKGVWFIVAVLLSASKWNWRTFVLIFKSWLAQTRIYMMVFAIAIAHILIYHRSLPNEPFERIWIRVRYSYRNTKEYSRIRIPGLESILLYPRKSCACSRNMHRNSECVLTYSYHCLVSCEYMLLAISIEWKAISSKVNVKEANSVVSFSKYLSNLHSLLNFNS